MSTADETRSTFTRSFIPDFVDEEHAIPEAITGEFVSVLVSENSDFVANLPEGYGSYATPELVQYLFTICVRLRLPDDVKYLALDIFDSFMNIQCLNIWDAVATCDKSNNDKFKIWEKTETSLSHQLTLRICSAIQIASKIHSYNDSLSKTDVRKCLQALGFPYIEEAIQKSELRILQTLNFNVNARRTPAVYMMNFLKLLVRRRPELVNNIDSLYRYCLFCLDYTLLNRNLVYEKILNIVHDGNPVPITKEKLARVQADYSLLACAVIIVGLVCTQGPAAAEVYITELSDVTRILEADISDASTGLLRTLLANR